MIKAGSILNAWRSAPVAAALCVLAAPWIGCSQTITTVAGGNPNALGDGGPATSANLVEPTGVAIDALGNLYIADYMDNRIRKVNTDHVITTVAGTGNSDATGDGQPGASTGIHLPWGVAVDSVGRVYFVERSTHRIRMLDVLGIVHTVAGTGTPGFSGDGKLATSAQLNNPFGVTLDSLGNVYIADTSNHRIRKVTTDGIINTVAGSGQASSSDATGPATKVGIFNPYSVAVDNAGQLYIAEGNRIRKVDTAGNISTFAGNGSAAFAGDGGPATKASLQTPQGVAVDGAGNVYIADSFNNRVRKVDTAGNISTIAGGHLGGGFGDGGPATEASLAQPIGLAFDGAGNLYIADTNHNCIRKVGGVAAAGSPTISAVLNGASLLPGIAPNAWGTIKGSGLAPFTDTWDKAIVNGKLPTLLDGVSVTVGGKLAYLYYISSTQINFVAPDIGFGAQQVVVTNGSLSSAAFTVTSSQYSPAFFPWPASQVVATRQDFSWAVKNGTFAGVTTIAAKPGDVIILWGTGFGPTTPVAPTGVQLPADQTYSAGVPPTVTVNSLPATVYGAALASGNAALYQVAIQVPPSIADGDWPVIATVAGIQSPTGVVLSVKR